MSALLDHSPSDIVRNVLIDLGLGSDPAANQVWPIFASGEPDKPDSCITVYDTAGIDLGRIQFDGEREESYGIQVRVRSAAHTAGHKKTNEIAIALDKDLLDMNISLGASDYNVWCANRSSTVLVLGRESPNTNRRLFTVNVIVVIDQIN